MSTVLARRRFLHLAAGSAGVAAVGGVGFAAGATGAAAAPKRAGGGGGGTAPRNPLFVPPVIVPADDGVLTTGLTAQEVRGYSLGGGRTSSVLVYGSTLPAPTFVVHRGDAVAATLTNALDGHTSIHWHGLAIPTAADGQPQEALHKGESYTYDFAVDQRAGLSFYHPHPHLHTASQVYKGMAGAFVVRDAEEDALGLPSGAHEVPLVLRDASYDSAGNLTYNGTASGFEGKFPLVNGTVDPYLDADAGHYRLRIVNGATARIFRLQLSTGAPFTLIGNDGGLLPRAVPQTWMDVSPGERVDVLVDLSQATAPLQLRCGLAGWTLLELRPTGKRGEVWSGPTTLSTITPLGQPTTTRRFSFDGMTKINGRLFDMARIDFRVPADTVEDWTFVTNGNAPHPVHVHGASFQVIERRGGGRLKDAGANGLFPWEHGWKDTVLLQNKEQVTVRIRFESRLVFPTVDDRTVPQRYLLHCHKLEHEDAGMMANFELT
jgi:blue copper oxidase